MKKSITIFALMCISLFIGGCTQNEIKTVYFTDNATSNTTLEQSEKVMTGKIIEFRHDSILVSDTKDNTGLYQVSIDPLKEDLSTIRQGDFIEIGFDGLVLEIYPAIIANPDYIKFIDKGEDFVGLYHDVFKDLYETDSGLNKGIEFIAIDFTNDNILMDSEKNALLYLISNTTQIETRLASYEDLLTQKLVSVDEETGFTQLNNGILFTIETSELEKDAFQFTAEKWRSSLGAYVFYDCTAKKEDGSWSYKIGAEMIS